MQEHSTNFWCQSCDNDAQLKFTLCKGKYIKTKSDETIYFPKFKDENDNFLVNVERPSSVCKTTSPRFPFFFANGRSLRFTHRI